MALVVEEVAPGLRMVIEMTNPQLGSRLTELVGNCTLLSAADLAAPAFVAAALATTDTQTFEIAGRMVAAGPRERIGGEHLAAIGDTRRVGMDAVLPADAGDIVLGSSLVGTAKSAVRTSGVLGALTRTFDRRARLLRPRAGDADPAQHALLPRRRPGLADLALPGADRVHHHRGRRPQRPAAGLPVRRRGHPALRARALGRHHRVDRGPADHRATGGDHRRRTREAPAPCRGLRAGSGRHRRGRPAEGPRCAGGRHRAERGRGRRAAGPPAQDPGGDRRRQQTPRPRRWPASAGRRRCSR